MDPIASTRLQDDRAKDYAYKQVHFSQWFR